MGHVAAVEGGLRSNVVGGHGLEDGPMGHFAGVVVVGVLATGVQEVGKVGASEDGVWVVSYDVGEVCFGRAKDTAVEIKGSAADDGMGVHGGCVGGGGGEEEEDW